MKDIDNIYNKLNEQINVLEKDMGGIASKFAEVEIYVGDRITNTRKVLTAMSASEDWISELSKAIDMLGEIQRIMEKVKEVDTSSSGPLEIPIDDDDICDAHGMARIARQLHCKTTTIRHQIESLKSLTTKKRRKRRVKKLLPKTL